MRKPRSFHGDIGLLSVANLFQLIGLSALSGKLVLRYDPDAAYFIFSDGKVNYGFLTRDRRKLGQTLIDSQLLTAEQLDTCLASQQVTAPWKKLGLIAVEHGYLNKAQISDLFYNQIKEAFFTALSWPEGTFSFVDSTPFTKGDIVLEENIDTLVFNGLIQLDEAENNRT